MPLFAAKIQHRYDMLAFVSRGGLSELEMQTGLFFSLSFLHPWPPRFFLTNLIWWLMGEVLTGLLSGLASAATVGGVFYTIFSDLKKEIDRLKIERIDKLEQQFDEHIDKDCSQEIKAKLDTLIGQYSKVSDKLDTISSETSRMGEEIKATKLYVSNLDNSFQRHKEIKHGS